MSDKVYSLAGFSTFKGERKIRVSNDSKLKRQPHLEKQGHTDVVFSELPYPMTRKQAEEFLQNGFVAQEQQTDTVLEELVDKLVETMIAPKMTIEEALAQIPKRNSKGHYIKGEERMKMAEELLQAA